MTPERERAVVEAAAERIRAFRDAEGRGGGYSFEGRAALEVLEDATGGFGPETVELARRALARAEDRQPGPETPEHVPEDRGLESWGPAADGTFRRV